MSELSNEQLQALEESGALALSSGATTLSILLNKQVSINNPRSMTLAPSDFSTVLKDPLVLVEVGAKVTGKPVTLGFVLTQQDTTIITDLMMGGEGTPPSTLIDDLQLSAISEAVNQMLGMAVNALNTAYGKKLEFQPPLAIVIDNPADATLPEAFNAGDVVLITYQMVIEGLATSTIVQLLPEASALTWADVYRGNSEKTVAAAPAAPAAMPPAAAPAAAAPPQAAPAPQPAYAPAPQPSYAPPPQPTGPPVHAQPAAFSPLPSHSLPSTPPSGLDLILDVPLRVTVELGRARMEIREVLELGKGSVVELDKLAGEPVDMLVNGKLIARGEVVVIDENFGIRVTDIVSPLERVSSFRS